MNELPTPNPTTMQGGILLILSMFSPLFSCLLESNKTQLFENTPLNLDFVANNFQHQDISQKIEFIEEAMPSDVQIRKTFYQFLSQPMQTVCSVPKKLGGKHNF